jgi:hypothetical protein
MPSAPLYSHRLAQAIKVLSSLDIEWIDRRALEEILSVSKWTRALFFRSRCEDDHRGAA